MDHKLKVMLGAACTILCGLSLSNQALGQTLPDDKGKAEFVHNCTACHLASMVVAARKTPDDWRKSVDEMASRGTDGTKEDLDNVVLYLDKYFALDPSASAPATQSTTPSSTPDNEHAKHVVAENGCLACHRIEQQGANTAPSLNGVGTRHTTDEIRAAILSHHSTSSLGTTHPGPSYEGKISAEDLDSLVHYLVTLPPLP
jgi:mono/diheme cytochrome c family protein